MSLEIDGGADGLDPDKVPGILHDPDLAGLQLLTGS